MGGLSFENEIFRLFATYGTVVVLKMMALSFFTSFKRLTKKVYATPEDVVFDGGDLKKHGRTDPDIERVRQCHRNDLENIPPFLIIGLLYIFTGPSVFAATWHYRLFVGSRFLHTIAYLLPLPQPSRALGFFVGVGVTVSMAVQVLQLAHF